MVSEPSLITPVNLNRYMRESIIALRQDVERLTRERDEARANAARFCGDNERLIKALNAESVEGALEIARRWRQS